MAESRSIEGDEVHAKLVAAIEKSERAHLWVPADAIEFTPHVLPLVYGDGRALFALTTINQRPAYWVIRGCSTWGCGLDRDSAPGPDFAELSDDILTDLENAFGSGRCGYSGESLFWPKEERHCDCEECQDDYVAKWPEVDGDGGCSWSRIDWPDGFDVVPHPLSGMGNLLAPPPPPQTNVEGARYVHVGFQWRGRASGNDLWSPWRDGPCPALAPKGSETEERCVYALATNEKD